MNKGLRGALARHFPAVMWRLARLETRPPKARRMPTDDRRILEDRIFAALFRASGPRRILSVGCHPYSAWYADLFNVHPFIAYETVDPDPAAAKFGSALHHWPRGFSDLKDEAALHGAYDVILINGVFGYGIDSEIEKRQAFATSAALLKKGGLLIIGYRYDLDLSGDFLGDERFSRGNVPGTNAALILHSRNGNRHSFVCLKKVSS